MDHAAIERMRRAADDLIVADGSGAHYVVVRIDANGRSTAIQYRSPITSEVYTDVRLLHRIADAIAAHRAEVQQTAANAKLN